MAAFKPQSVSDDATFTRSDVSSRYRARASWANGIKLEDRQPETGSRSSAQKNMTGAKRYVVKGRYSSMFVDSDEEFDIGLEGEDQSIVRASWKDIFNKHSMTDKHDAFIQRQRGSLTDLERASTSSSFDCKDFANPASSFVDFSLLKHHSFDSNQRHTIAQSPQSLSRASSLERFQPAATAKDRNAASSGTKVRKTFVLGDHDSINAFFTETLESSHQSELKPILKATIKFIEPNKQKKWPYVLSADSPKAKLGAKHRREEGIDGNPQPPWWPLEVRHCEPDHLKKFENAKLGVALLWYLIKDRTLHRRTGGSAVKMLFLDQISRLLTHKTLCEDEDDSGRSSNNLTFQEDTDNDEQAENDVPSQDFALADIQAMPRKDVKKQKELERRRKVELARKANARAARMCALYKVAIECSNANFDQCDTHDQIHIEYEEPHDDSNKQKKSAGRGTCARGRMDDEPDDGLRSIRETSESCPAQSLPSMSRERSASNKMTGPKGKKRKALDSEDYDPKPNTRQKKIARVSTRQQQDHPTDAGSSRSTSLDRASDQHVEGCIDNVREVIMGATSSAAGTEVQMSCMESVIPHPCSFYASPSAFLARPPAYATFQETMLQEMAEQYSQRPAAIVASTSSELGHMQAMYDGSFSASAIFPGHHIMDSDSAMMNGNAPLPVLTGLPFCSDSTAWTTTYPIASAATSFEQWSQLSL